MTQIRIVRELAKGPTILRIQVTSVTELAQFALRVSPKIILEEVKVCSKIMAPPEDVVNPPEFWTLVNDAGTANVFWSA